MPLTISQVMEQPPVLVDEGQTLEVVARLMIERGVSCVGVVDGRGTLLGVLRDEDFAAKEHALPFSTEMAPQLFGEWIGEQDLERDYAAVRTRRAGEVVQRGGGTIDQDSRLHEAMPLLQRGHGLLVVREGRPVGTLGRRDLLKLVAGDTARERPADR